MIEVYASVYTEEEIKDIIKFYKSPAGQKMLAKMPELMNASMAVVQNLMKDVMPKINDLQKKLNEKLKKKTNIEQ